MSRCCAKPPHAATAQPPSTSGVTVPQEAMKLILPWRGRIDAREARGEVG